MEKTFFFGGVEHLGEHSIQHQKLIDGKKRFCVWSFCWPFLFEVVTTATSKQSHVEAVTTATSKKHVKAVTTATGFSNSEI